MKIKLFDQIIFTLQNFLTSLLIIKAGDTTEQIVDVTSVFIFLSLNSFLINSTYIEFLLKCKMRKFSNGLNFGYGSVLIFLICIFNFACLLISSKLFQSSVFTFACIVSCITIPIYEAVRQYHLNISKALNGLWVDSSSVIIQILTAGIFWQLGQLNSFAVLISWLAPSWILAPFFTLKLLKNFSFLALVKYKEMGFHLGIAESILSALQLWFLLKVLNSFYDDQSMAAFVIGITLVRPLFMVATLLRSLKLSEIYSGDGFLRDRIIARYSAIIVFTSACILVFIWIAVDNLFVNLGNENSFKLLYTAILLRTTIGFLYAKAYYALRIEGMFGRLLTARVIEWLTIYLLVLGLSPKLGILQMNLVLMLGTVLHFVIIKSALSNFSMRNRD